MFARRRLIALLGIGALAALPRPGAAKADLLSQAAEFIRESGVRFVALTTSGSTPADRQRNLHEFIAEVVDVAGLARFCRSRFWNSADPEQRREYLAVFHRVLVTSASIRMGEHTQDSTRFTAGRPVETASGIEAPTTLERANVAPVRVVWTVSVDAGQPRIIDVTAEGVSLGNCSPGFRDVA
jgi:phospholipid transport system substrate-binding protein